MKTFALVAALVALVSAGAAFAGPGQVGACTAGTTTCTNDGANAQFLQSLANTPDVQKRFFMNYMGQCAFIYSEAAGATGHAQRVAFCQSIAAERVPLDMLVMAVFAVSPTVQAQALCTQAVSNQGCMVDADINTAIGAVLTVNAGGGLATRAWP